MALKPAPFVLSVSLALAAAAPLAGGEPGKGPAPAAPFRVVQTDGTTLVLSGPPEEKGGQLVGRLHGSGQLVSFPKRSLDAERTARANEAPPRPAPAPTPAARLLDDGQRPLGTQYPLKTNPEEARRKLESAKKGSSGAGPAGSAPEARPPAPETSRAAAPEEPRDRSDRNEAWWRSQSSSRRRELDAAAARLKAAEAELDAADKSIMVGSEAQRNTWALRVQAARDEVAAARAEQDRAKRQWDELEEDARRSGTPPGWLR